VCSRDIPHKSDVGGVALGLDTPGRVREAYAGILGEVARHAPQADIRGILVSPMRPPGLELVVGITVDPTFGRVLTVGLGGLWVEVMRDSALRVLPVGPVQVLEMISELRGASLLSGARGQRPVDLDGLAGTITRIGAAALSLGERLDTLEINPLRLSASGPEALDVLVMTWADA
jgi:hypothetical protein